jgi:spore coat polysaccharide biosynthesis protein SpsF
MSAALGLIQARMGSTRLPDKSLAEIAGRPLVVLVLERLRRARRLSDIVVATSTEAADDPLVAAVEAADGRVHRGPAQDVLARLASAAAGHDGPLLRVTADCPFIDPRVADAAIELLDADEGCAYASNVEPRTYPDGLDVEAIAGWALADAHARATEPADREHVTLLIRRDPERYPHAVLSQPDGQLADVRWTIDYAEDLEFVRAVAGRLGDRLVSAPMDEVLAAVRREPSLTHFHDRWGPRA